MGDEWFRGLYVLWGEVEEQRVDYDYRRRERLLVISNVPAGVCCQCGEKYFPPDVLKSMDETYHEIFDQHKAPERVLEVPAVSFQNGPDGSPVPWIRATSQAGSPCVIRVFVTCIHS